MKINLSFRTRIFLALFLLSAILSLALATVIIFSGEKLEYGYLDSAFEDEMEFLRSADIQKSEYLPNSQHTVGFLSSSTHLPAVFKGLSEGSHHDVAWGDRRFHVYVTPYRDDKLYLAFDISIVEQYEEDLVALVFFITLFALSLSLIFGYGLTNLLSAPIVSLATSISKLTESSDRFPYRTHDKDLSVIENALDKYLQQISGYIRQEKVFSAVTSHELRTPISSMLATLEMLEKNPAFLETEQRRLQRLKRAAKEMQYVSESLLQLVKQPKIHAAHCEEPVALAALIAEVIEEFNILKRSDDVELRYSVEQDMLVYHEPQLVKLVVGNLVRNALNNTLDGYVLVRLTAAGCIEVTDSGHGMPVERIEKYNANIRAGVLPGESGLGLIIVSKLCSQFSWSVLLLENQPKGLKVVVNLAIGKA